MEKSGDINNGGDRDMNEMVRKNVLNCIRLDGALECCICSNLATTPVYSCSGGHVFCGICFAGGTRHCCIDNCKGYGEPIRRCEVAEEILKIVGATFHCRNALAGCKVELRTGEMMSHLEICPYRAVRCFEKREVDCRGKVCTLDKFVRHLLSEHKVPKMEFENGTTGIVRYFLHDEINATNADIRKTAYFQYHEMVFLFHQIRDAGFLFHWITLVGNEADAKGFHFHVKMSGGNDIPSDIEISRTGIAVQAFEMADFNRMMESGSGNFMATHCSNIAQLSKQGILHGNLHYYVWLIEIQIEKI